MNRQILAVKLFSVGFVLKKFSRLNHRPCLLLYTFYRIFHPIISLFPQIFNTPWPDHPFERKKLRLLWFAIRQDNDWQSNKSACRLPIAKGKKWNTDTCEGSSSAQALFTITQKSGLLVGGGEVDGGYVLIHTCAPLCSSAKVIPFNFNTLKRRRFSRTRTMMLLWTI